MKETQGQGLYKTRKRGDTDTEEKPRGDGGRDGREAATSPGTDAWSPQKLEEVGRTLPWRLCRELSRGTLDLRRLVSRAGEGWMSVVLSPLVCGHLL